MTLSPLAPLALAFPAALLPADLSGAGLISRADRFVENRGQWDARVAFLTMARRGTAVVEKNAIEIGPGHLGTGWPSGRSLRLEFEGARSDCVPEGCDELDGAFHYFLGDDPSRWARNARSYRSVVWRDLYPGVDVVLRRNPARELEYDLRVRPGADASSIRIECRGSTRLWLDKDGSLIADAPGLRLRQPRPMCWFESSQGAVREAELSYEILDDWSFTFRMPDRPAAETLVIDPGLEWATFIGGAVPDPASGNVVERAPGVSITSSGEVLVGGFVFTQDYPSTPGSYQPNNLAWGDAFVTRLTSDGSGLVYSTFIGGSNARDVRLTRVSLVPRHWGIGSRTL